MKIQAHMKKCKFGSFHLLGDTMACVQRRAPPELQYDARMTNYVSIQPHRKYLIENFCWIDLVACRILLSLLCLLLFV